MHFTTYEVCMEALTTLSLFRTHSWPPFRGTPTRGIDKSTIYLTGISLPYNQCRTTASVARHPSSTIISEDLLERGSTSENGNRYPFCLESDPTAGPKSVKIDGCSESPLSSVTTRGFISETVQDMNDGSQDEKERHPI